MVDTKTLSLQLLLCKKIINVQHLPNSAQLAAERDGQVGVGVGWDPVDNPEFEFSVCCSA